MVNVLVFYSCCRDVMKLSSSCSSSSVTDWRGRVNPLSTGRGLGLHLCRQKGLGKFHRVLGCGLDCRGLRKVGWTGLGVLKFIWGLNIS